MTYREKLELYSQGKLDEQQKIEIEQDLEKQEALADYLFEHQAPPGMEDLFDEEPAFGAKAAGGNDSNAKASITENNLITKQINWSIRKAFIKTGVVAVIIAIAISLFITLALPRIVSAFYYDPGKVVTIGTEEDGYTECQFEIDMNALIETSIPELGMIYTDINALFHTILDVDGDYIDVTKTLAGEIRRGSISISNPDVFKNFAVNNVYPFFPDGNMFDESKHTSDVMNSHDVYYAYVSLKREMPYEQFYSKYAVSDTFGTIGNWVWCRVLPSKYYYGFIGFYATGYSIFSDGTENEYSLDTEEKAIKHFRKLVKHLKDSEYSKTIRSFDDIDPSRWGAYEDYLLSKNGLNIRDFIYVSDKMHIEKLREDKNVAHITTKEVE